GFSCDVERLVLSRARRAMEAGCDGVISSGLEAARLKSEFKERLLVVTPGIRPVENRADDQKRTVDVAQAFANGADYIVVGRPIRQAAEPRAAAVADSMHALAGMAGLVALAWLASEARRSVPWRAVAAGILLELAAALVCLKLPGVKSAFLALNDALLVLERATEAGTSLVFGYL